MAVTLARKKSSVEAGELPIAPMIDIVFLLLVYFMVTSSIQKQEADIGLSLPATVTSSQPVEFPDEQVIEIDAAGRAWVNGYGFDAPAEPRYPQLSQMLQRFRESSEAGSSAARVTIAPAGQNPHQLVVRVMDACEAAGLRSVSLAVQ